MGQPISVSRGYSNYRVYWVHLGNRGNSVYLATVSRSIRVILSLPTIGRGFRGVRLGEYLTTPGGSSQDVE